MFLKDVEPKLRNAIIRAIRQWFTKSDKYDRIKRAARVESIRYKKDGSISKVKKVEYRCRKCRGLFKSDEINVDHISCVVPVINAAKNLTIKQYINQVDCPESNLQVLCTGCHDVKTKKENASRLKLDRSGNVLKGNYKKYKKKPVNSLNSKPKKKNIKL